MAAITSSTANPFNGMTYNGAVRKWLEGVKHAEGKKAKFDEKGLTSSVCSRAEIDCPQ
jgi:hypothetical protein